MRQIRDLEEARELVRAAVDIVEVMRALGVEIPAVGATHAKACCPFHREKDPSFHVNIAKQLWFCHGACKRGGDVFAFVQEMEQVSHVEAVHRLAEIAGFDLTPYLRDLTPEEREREALYAANRALWESLPSARGHAWRAERRLDVQTVEDFGLRYSRALPRLDVPAAHARLLGFSADKKQAWRWEEAIVIPMIDGQGRIAGFRNRFLAPRKGMKIAGPAEGHPLPLPPLLGLREARRAVREAGYLILVEGEVDWLQMVSHGWEHTACLMGSQFGAEHLAYLEEHGVRQVVLMPDGDRAGRHLARTVAEARRPASLILRVAALPDGDPDEILLSDPAQIERAVTGARYAFEYLLDAALAEHETETITGKMDALADLRPYFSAAPDHERDLAVRALARRLGMEPDSVLDYFREAPADAPTAALQNVRAERIVLASMLDDDDFAGDALLDLRPEHFWLTRHRRIFESIQTLYTTSDAVTRGTVETHLRNRGDEGLAAYAAALQGDPAERHFMARDVRDKAVRRATLAQVRDAVSRLSDPAVDARDAARRLSASIAQVVVGGAGDVRPAAVAVRDRMQTLMEQVRSPAAIVGLDLGPEWRTLNLTLHGLRSRRLMILAAGSSVGKTAVALSWTRRIGVELQEPVLYFSFETDEETMLDRLIAQISGVETDKLVTGYMTREEVVAVQEAAMLIARSPIVFTSRGRTLQEALTIARHDVLKRGTRVIFFDYLQLMRVEGWRDRRDLELGEISSQLLGFTREHDTRVIAQAQITRAGMKSGESQTKEDVGESYKMAQDADEFLLLRMKTREEMEEDGPQKGDRFAFLDKHRGGRRGVGFPVLADESVMRYSEA